MKIYDSRLFPIAARVTNFGPAFVNWLDFYRYIIYTLSKFAFTYGTLYYIQKLIIFTNTKDERFGIFERLLWINSKFIKILSLWECYVITDYWVP